MLFFKLKDKLFYGWVIVAAFLIIFTTIIGARFSFGVFFKSIEGEFELTRAATSSIFSTYMLFTVLFGVLGGWALDKYGPKPVMLLTGFFAGLGLILTSQTSSLWQLYITYSLFFAIGSGIVFVATQSTVSKWFNKKRGLALGIAGSGAGLGTLVIPPLSAYLISNLDWRTAYLVLGILALVIVIPMSTLLKREPSVVGTLPDGVKPASLPIRQQDPANQGASQLADLSVSEAVRTRSFWIFSFIRVLGSSGRFMILTHIVPHTTDIGFSTVEAATVLSLIGVAAIAGRILMGAVSDRIGYKLTAIICSAIKTVAMVGVIWANELWMLYLFAIFFGFVWGGLSPGLSGLLGKTFGLRRMGTIMGLMQIGFGIGAAAGPVLAGYIFDINNSYTIAFLLGAIFIFTRTFLITMIRKETVSIVPK
ncbi:MFS transporter [Chloroflexota bacterium]